MARFSKAQYDMLAAALRTARPRDPDAAGRYSDTVGPLNRRSQWREDIVAVTDMLALDNQAFDRNRFLEAVGW